MVMTFSSNRMQKTFKIYSKFVKYFLADNSDCCRFLRLGRDKLGTEVRYNSSFTNCQGKKCSGVESVILLPNILYHIFQSMNLETFRLKRTHWTGNLGWCSILLKWSILLEFFRVDVRVWNLIIFESSDCFIIAVIWTFYTIGVPNTTDSYFFAV